MKTLLSRRPVRFGGFAMALLLALWSCKQDATGPTGFNLPLNPPSGGSSTPAHPAIVYGTSVTSHGTNYGAIGVMDTDGSHQTIVYTASGSASELHPWWSPDGSSVVWAESGNAIKTMSITVNSNGVPVGSNLTTIATNSGRHEVSDPSWCSQSSTGKIAFIYDTGHSPYNVYGYRNNLAVMNTDGSSVTVIASEFSFGTQNFFTTPAWSPDDSKLAAVRYDSAVSTWKIVIFDMTNGGAPLDSIDVGHSVSSLEWSRSGSNYLLYANNFSGYIYYVTPSTGSTPTTNSVQGGFATWSPNNSGVMYTHTGAMDKDRAFTASTTQVLRSGPNDKNWKR